MSYAYKRRKKLIKRGKWNFKMKGMRKYLMKLDDLFNIK